MASYFIFSGNHALELGAGPVLANLKSPVTDPFNDRTGWNVFSTLRLGYAYLPTHSGVLFRAAYTPFISDKIYHHWGIGVGYLF